MRRSGWLILALLLLWVPGCAPETQDAGGIPGASAEVSPSIGDQASGSPSATVSSDIQSASPTSIAASSDDVQPSRSPSPSQGATTSPAVLPSPAPSPVLPSVQPSDSNAQDEDMVSLKIFGKEGSLILEGSWPVEEGATAFEVLEAACGEKEVSLEVRGSGSIAYIVAIDGLAEFADGALSGWIYKVNGVQAARGVGATSVAPGDRLSFYYSLDLGADVAELE